MCFLPSVPFVLKSMTAIGFNFSSDRDGIVGTGFMAGYATYEGTISRITIIMVAITRLCSKENFREPFGLPSILFKSPRPSWSPE